MLSNLLSVVVLVCSGTVAGVFFAVAVSVIPVLASMPPGRYVEIHRELGAGYHPVMPIVVTAVLAGDIALAFVAPQPQQRVIWAICGVLQVGVQAISHLRNEMLNRRVRAVPAGDVPAGWADPRTAWRRWHLARSALAMAVLALSGVATVLPS